MIHGISIENYRSIGERQNIAPLGKINLFVGPNNCGKSNILRFINDNLLNTIAHLSGKQANVLSEPHVRRGGPTASGLALGASGRKIHDALGGHILPQLESALKENLLDDDLLWVWSGWPENDLIEQASAWADRNLWYHVWTRMTQNTNGEIKRHWIPDTLQILKHKLMPTATAVYAIPVNRVAGHAEEDQAVKPDARCTVLGGRRAVLDLAALQNPPAATFEEFRGRFEKIKNFVRLVTDDSTAEISVPHKQDEILVRFKGQRYFPLALLGSGIEQVVLHAIAATSVENSIVTFEEPELHMHPVLQRQLMKFLVNTSNQYFISTHSAHLIDVLHVNTFHVRLAEGETVVEWANTDASRHRICEELGYRPSDLVQANCIIWVEGPSDRVYVNHWLKQVDEHLCEHVHFSIMFYGGKLLSHLSAGEADGGDGLENIIRLRELNRQTAVIMDSDLSAAGKDIRGTKERVRREICEHGGFVWITAGREIENYVAPAVLEEAVEKIAPGLGSSVKRGRWKKVLPARGGNQTQTVDKVKVAHAVAERPSDFAILDLGEKLKELVAFIRGANGLPSAG